MCNNCTGGKCIHSVKCMFVANILLIIFLASENKKVYKIPFFSIMKNLLKILFYKLNQKRKDLKIKILKYPCIWKYKYILHNRVLLQLQDSIVIHNT